MSLSDEQGQMIGNELRRFAGDINLSDEQKTKLHERLAFAAGRLFEYKKSHPEVTRQDIIKAVGSRRAELREGLERFLTPEQLTKWDAEMAKAKTFLGRLVEKVAKGETVYILKGQQHFILQEVPPIDPVPTHPAGYFAQCYDRTEIREENRLAKASVIRPSNDR